jgi:hypothetical protein
MMLPEGKVEADFKSAQKKLGEYQLITHPQTESVRG